MPFVDRRHAGRQLAAVMQHLGSTDPVVLGLPRGGVPVAYEVARALDAQLDVVVVRKLGCPGQPEVGLGAIGEDGVVLLNTDLVQQAQVSASELQAVRRKEARELERRVRRCRHGRPATDLTGRTVLVIDDGLATGFTARAAIEVVRRRGAGRVVLGVPVAAPQAITELLGAADEVVCLESPQDFGAIGRFYADFSPTSDAEVAALLAQTQAAVADRTPPTVHRTVAMPVDEHGVLTGELSIPAAATGLVVFAHGSGSSRRSPRNLAVARALNDAGLATLLFDLLTEAESVDRDKVFDIGLLAARLAAATHWVRQTPETAALAIGFFGASTGAATALSAAARLGTDVRAVVSRGGRPDLAKRLAEVTAPTLLIVGSRDQVVLELNELARRQLRCPSRLEIVSGATHLFEETGALERVAALAADWFNQHLTPVRSAAC